MKVIEVDNPKVWNDFVSAHSSPSVFLQCFEWGEYQERIGRKVFRLSVVDESFDSVPFRSGANLVAVAEIIKMPLPLGRSWFYSPHGPVLIQEKGGTREREFGKKVYDVLLEKVKEIGEQEKSVWWRVEPVVLENKTLRQAQGDKKEGCEMGFGKPRILTSYQQPKCTLMVDLSKSEEELLMHMRSKTRYNIRLAERKGVEVREIGNKGIRELGGVVDAFYSLMQETGRRDGISVHPKEWYEALVLHEYDKEGMEVELIWAIYEGKMVAANILVHFGDMTTYLHGASGSEYRNIMAPHLLQWESIRRAKKRGSKWYDFWGIEGMDPGKGSWAGITRFKRGFVSLEVGKETGKEIAYIGAYDKVLGDTWYRLYIFGSYLSI